MVGERFIKRFAEDDNVVAVAWPRIADAAVLCAADDLYVDATPVVLALRSALLVVDGISVSSTIHSSRRSVGGGPRRSASVHA
jgi:hypothetical protein